MIQTKGFYVYDYNPPIFQPQIISSEINEFIKSFKTPIKVIDIKYHPIVASNNGRVFETTSALLIYEIEEGE